MGTHMRALSESYLKNTNMTGIRWSSKIFVSLCLDESSLSIRRVKGMRHFQTRRLMGLSCEQKSHFEIFTNVIAYTFFLVIRSIMNVSATTEQSERPSINYRSSRLYKACTLAANVLTLFSILNSTKTWSLQTWRCMYLFVWTSSTFHNFLFISLWMS